MKWRSIAAILCCLVLFTAAAAAAVEVETLTVSAMNRENLAPEAEHLTLSTYRNTTAGGSFQAVDPEGDLLEFRLVTQPMKGSVRVDGADFLYTPAAGKRGKDVFSYEAVDSQGNVSAAALITVHIRKQKTEIRYADLQGTALEYPALRLAESGIFTGEQVGCTHCFAADTVVTRGEFLTMCAVLTDMAPLDGVTRTGFSDDGEIGSWQKPYVSAALLYGVVKGSAENGQVLFRPTQPVTMAEAAVMLNSFLEISNSARVFAPAGVPDWAAQAVSNLNACDITAGSGFSASAVLTRGEAANLLGGALDLLEQRGDSGFRWAK